MRYATPLLSVTQDGRMPFGVDDPAIDGVGAFGQTIVAAYRWSETLPVPTDDDRVACEALFHEANVGTDGWAGRYREGCQRSLSVGDLIEVRDEDTDAPRYYQVLSMGVGQLTGDAADDVEVVAVDRPWDYERDVPEVTF